jgi:hypothetical protein
MGTLKNKSGLVQIFISVIFVMSLCGNLFSEEIDNAAVWNSDPDWSLTIYPLSTASIALLSTLLTDGKPWIYVSAEAEYKLNRFFSIPVEVRYFRAKHTEWILTQTEVSMELFMVGPGLRLYPQGIGIRGAFIGHYIQFMYSSEKKKFNKDIFGEGAVDENESGYDGLPGNYLSFTWIGYRWQLDKHFHVESSMGVFGTLPIKDRDKSGLFTFAGIGLGLGIMF